MVPLSKGQNPRKTLTIHRERGPAQYPYTVADIARVSGAPLSIVKRACCRLGGQPAELDIRDLASVVAFCQREHDRRYGR